MDRTRWLFLAVLFLGLSACASLHRDARSGYGDNDEQLAEAPVQRFYQERMTEEEQNARDELGFSDGTLSEKQQAQLDDRMSLHRMEARLESRRDKKQYYSVRAFMKNDRQRMAFLSLPDYATKQRWLASKGLLNHEETYSEPVAKAIESKDIALGMSQKAVRESWGDPDLVEVAGDPVYGYERWNYHRFVAGADGYQKELRIVYFDGGRVVGWETED